MGPLRIGFLVLLSAAACGTTKRNYSDAEPGGVAGGSGEAGMANGGTAGADPGGGGTASDREGPTVVEVSPEDDASDVPVDTEVSVLFSEEVKESTLGAESFTLRDQIGGVVSPGSVEVEDGSLGVFTPESPLRRGTMYTASVTTDVTDLAGNALVAEESWSFLTEAPSWGDAGLIETDNEGAANPPNIAVDAAGNAVAVWSQSDGTRSNAFANRYVRGSGWGTATLIETENAGSATSPEVAIDAAGNAIAVWSQWDDPSDSIWANRYVVGSGWGTATLIEADDAGAARYPQVALSPDGNGVAVWYQWDGNRDNIWANRYVVGSGWGTATLIETDDVDSAGNPQVAIDGDGNAMAVWSQSDGTKTDIWANRYVVGSGWGTATLIETDDVGNAMLPQVAIDGDGNAVAVWSQSDGTKTNIWANRWVVGAGWGAATVFETDDPGSAVAPQVAIDGPGNAMVVWSQSEGIWANRYVVGSGWGTASFIETDNPGNASSPQVAIDESGNAVAVWSQWNDGRGDVWANRYVAGLGWSDSTLIETDNAGSVNSPQVEIGGAGNTVVVWSQYDGTRSNIWANVLQ